MLSACRPERGSRSHTGTLLVARFQALNAHNKELQAKNHALREQLLLKERPSTATDSNGPSLVKQPCPGDIKRATSKRSTAGCPERDANFEFFCQQLAAMGVNGATEDAGQDLQELFQSVQRQEVQITKKGGRLLQQYCVVRVYLLANIAGSEQCLIEHDRLDLKSGKQKTLMIPLEIRMREGQDWRDAVRAGLRTMVGLEADWQDRYITVDESSHICIEEQTSAHDENSLDFLISATVHEVHVRVNGYSSAAKNALLRLNSLDTMMHEDPSAELAQIGLPSGRDFVYCEEGQATVHVWCWKSREYERNGRMKAFEKYLADHGVDTSKLGMGNNKTLFKFYEEVKEEKHCSLLEVPVSPEESTMNLLREARPIRMKLLRIVRILKIKLIAVVNKRNRVLMENEKYDAGGRKRASGQLIIKKLCEDDNWRSEVPVAITERIGVRANLQNECFSVDFEKMTYTEEEVPSKGFVGIMSRYKIITVPVYVIDPSHAELERIGLPRGNDFVSKKFSDGEDQPKLHVWSWAPAMDEEDAKSTFAGTALETLNRDLFDIEHVLTRAIADPQILALGLDKPFKTSLQKLKQCAEGVANIDKTVKDVDVGDIMGRSEGGAPDNDGGPTAMSGLKTFIESNFVRAALPGGQGDRERRRKSRTESFSLETTNLSDCSLDQIFSEADPVLQSIVTGRNEWEFDFFKLYKRCGTGALMLESYGEAMLVPFCVLALGCEEHSARAFVTVAASQYLEDNFYHGPIHAAQVCHSSRWLTKAMRIMEIQSELESTAFMIAAFCHDIKHIGRNNNFCVVSEHPLALVYNNSSVLEKYHSSTCLGILETSGVLTKLSRVDRSLVRSHIVGNILATDMAEHFETISKFRVRREAHDFSDSVESDRVFIAKLCLKAGDLGHGGLPWNLHLQWATRVVSEFYSQGDEETRLGLPISALCNRSDVVNLGKSQNGFLNFVVAPLYQLLSDSQPAPDKAASSAEPTPPQKVDDESTSLVKANRSKRRIQTIAAAAPTSLKSAALAVEVSFSIEQSLTEYLVENSSRWSNDYLTVAKIIDELTGGAKIVEESQEAEEGLS